MAVFSFYGFEGSKMEWNGIPLYPNDVRDWGVKYNKMFYDDHKADILLTLQDTWVLQKLDVRMNWVPWAPIDHDPAPPEVLNMLKNHGGIVKPIAMSKYGQRKLKDAGIDSYYIPHGVNTHLFSPQEEWRKDLRKQHGWDDKFVIGTVGTNTVERKNWIASLKAVKEFYSKHKDVAYYMHTDMHHSMGIDLDALRYELGLEDITYYPKFEKMVIGVRAEALAHLYNAMDVFLLPSKGEGFGIPIVEAQSCGVPVITTNCTAQPELVDGGWLVKDLTPTWTAQGSWQFECNPHEIALYLEEAYEEWKSGKIAERKEKARAKAKEYEWDVLIPEYWKPTLEDIEKRIHLPKNCEGIQEWRMYFIPHQCVPRKVLDIGCGVTQPYRKILEQVGDYTGIDIKGGENVTVCDCHHLPYEDKEFGFVWMSEVLEHLDNPAQAVAEAKRVGEHGVILFSTPLNPFFKMDPSHKVVNIPYQTVATGDGLIAW
jgi:glycosyltransferase involved in cell wall biosynthesis